MSMILRILTGQIPEELQELEKKARKRAAWHKHPEYAESRAKSDRERYATDEDYRENRLARKREAWAKTSPERKAELYQREKARIAAMTPEQYQRRLELNRAACKRFREKKKAAAASNT